MPTDCSLQEPKPPPPTRIGCPHDRCMRASIVAGARARPPGIGKAPKPDRSNGTKGRPPSSSHASTWPSGAAKTTSHWANWVQTLHGRARKALAAINSGTTGSELVTSQLQVLKHHIVCALRGTVHYHTSQHWQQLQVPSTL